MLAIAVAAIPVSLFAGERIALLIFGEGVDYADKKLIAVLLFAALVCLIDPWLLTVHERDKKQPET